MEDLESRRQTLVELYLLFGLSLLICFLPEFQVEWSHVRRGSLEENKMAAWRQGTGVLMRSFSPQFKLSVALFGPLRIVAIKLSINITIHMKIQGFHLTTSCGLMAKRSLSSKTSFTDDGQNRSHAYRTLLWDNCSSMIRHLICRQKVPVSIPTSLSRLGVLKKIIWHFG